MEPKTAYNIFDAQTDRESLGLTEVPSRNFNNRTFWSLGRQPTSISSKLLKNHKHCLVMSSERVT